MVAIKARWSNCLSTRFPVHVIVAFPYTPCFRQSIVAPRTVHEVTIFAVNLVAISAFLAMYIFCILYYVWPVAVVLSFSMCYLLYLSFSISFSLALVYFLFQLSSTHHAILTNTHSCSIAHRDTDISSLYLLLIRLFSLFFSFSFSPFFSLSLSFYRSLSFFQRLRTANNLLYQIIATTGDSDLGFRTTNPLELNVNQILIRSPAGYLRSEKVIADRIASIKRMMLSSQWPQDLFDGDEKRIRYFDGGRDRSLDRSRDRVWTEGDAEHVVEKRNELTQKRPCWATGSATTASLARVRPEFRGSTTARTWKQRT